MPKFEYTLVALMEPAAVGTEFISWPLHVMLVPWFRGPLKQLSPVVKRVAAARPPIHIITSKETHFGSDRDILVRLVEPTEELHQLHWDLLRALEADGFKLVSKQFCGPAFVPHLTKRGAKTIPEGTSLTIDRVYLVRAPVQERPTERTKRILRQFRLAP